MPFGRLSLRALDIKIIDDRCFDLSKKIQAGTLPTKRDLLLVMREWVNAFGPMHSTEKSMARVETLLATSMFIANREILTYESKDVGLDYGYIGKGGRTIYSSPGRPVQKPVLSKAGLIVLSSLKGLLLISLAYLTWYTYQVPTWTTALDALAMARVCASIEFQTASDESTLPAKQHMTEALGSSGLVGIVPENQLLEEARRRTSPNNISPGTENEAQQVNEEENANAGKMDWQIRLGLGAPGVINRKSARGIFEAS